MPEFLETAVCRAPPRTVWKLLYDPARFARWWPGWERVEPGPDGQVTHYDDRWPEYPYPSRVHTDPAGGRVMVSCLTHDVTHQWSLEPDAAGCRVRVRVLVPDAQTAKADFLADNARTALAALAAAAEAEAGPAGAAVTPVGDPTAGSD